MRTIKENTSLPFYLFIAIALLLTNIPIVGSYVRIINTVVHETGHAFMALIGGDVHTISLFMNTEGVTFTSHTSWFGGFFTGISGYVFSSVFAFVFFWLISRKKYKLVVAIILVLISLNLIFWVRNLYGIFWLVSFGALFILLLYKGSPKIIQNSLLLIASILLVESISSAYTILYLSFVQPHAAGDATGLAGTTVFIPAQIWGIFFFVQSLFFLWLGLKNGNFKLERL